VIKKLIDAGISLQRIRKAVVYLREHLGTEPTSVTLMSDGVRIYACESPDEIIDVMSKGQGVFAIALDKVWEDLAGSLRRRKELPQPALARAGGA
jgi:hypothetical protein